MRTQRHRRSCQGFPRSFLITIGNPLRCEGLAYKVNAIVISTIFMMTFCPFLTTFHAQWADVSLFIRRTKNLSWVSHGCLEQCPFLPRILTRWTKRQNCCWDAWFYVFSTKHSNTTTYAPLPKHTGFIQGGDGPFYGFGNGRPFSGIWYVV